MACDDRAETTTPASPSAGGGTIGSVSTDAAPETGGCLLPREYQCPKCGGVMRGPHYNRGTDKLDYACMVCDYRTSVQPLELG